jgi:hypothetical protein
MSDRNSSAGGGGIGLITLISGIYAYGTTPTLTGLKGVFGAAMIGSGTSLMTGVCALTGGLLGAAFGAAVGSVAGKPGAGAAAGGIALALAGALYGIPTGYDLATDIVVDGEFTKPAITETITQEANDNSEYLTSSNQIILPKDLVQKYPMLKLQIPA